MKDLLDHDEHKDVVFKIVCDNFYTVKEEYGEPPVDETKVVLEVLAHKAILVARTEYFRSMFARESGPQAVLSASLEEDEEEDAVDDEEEEEEQPQEQRCPQKVRSSVGGSEQDSERGSEAAVVQVDPEFNERHVRSALEFIYTNRIVDIQDASTDHLISLMKLANKWILRDLKRLVELELIRSRISSGTVARLYGAADVSSGKRLREACIKFIMANLKALTSNVRFKEEMKNFPEICIPVLKAAADLIPEGPVHKKQRTDVQTGTPSSAIAAFRSSPVPDSDQ